MPRKLPFSAKRKKQQLRDRRERKRGDGPAGPASGPGSRSGSRERGGDGPPGDPPSEPPRRHDPGRFRLQLGGPRAEALERSRRRAQEELLEPLPESALELEPDSVYGHGLDFPRRPPWSFGISPEELRRREEAAFGDFLRALGDTPGDTPGDSGGDSGGDRRGLAPFEHNLETWRQLWRVLEMSDIVLLIADARHPALGVPPSLCSHITQDLAKGLILILNKVDLTPPAVATAWSHLLRARYGPARVVPFSTNPGAPPGPGKCGIWGEFGGFWEDEEEEPPGGEEEEEEEGAGPGGVAPPRQWERYRHGVLTLGCVGLPNAGKSSVLNAVLGRSAVGVSRAPGRTRYFQTHFLTATVRLCDCPGLVFPSRAPPELQVLAGVYPIAQLQDPYSAVGFLGSRLALPPLLQLRPPSGPGWTAWELCEAWAEQRGYKTARAARNDVARAANALLRMAAEGRIRLCMRPPGYSLQKEHWELHPDTAAMAAMTGGGASAPPPARRRLQHRGRRGGEPEEATPPPSPAPNPFALLGEDEC
ncbi:LOW QUALITY PROTEIN: guanine nucleotide-binding protein-like 1 [Passerculus sandwichensis]